MSSYWNRAYHWRFDPSTATYELWLEDAVEVMYKVGSVVEEFGEQRKSFCTKSSTQGRIVFIRRSNGEEKQASWNSLSELWQEG